MSAHKPPLADVKDVLGVVVSDVPVRLIDVSRTGCLLESGRHLQIGATGEFVIEVAGQTLSEEVRITRCLRLEVSGSLYRLGAEFLRRRPANVSSLRRAVYDMLGAKQSTYSQESET
jgi:PilZ domain